MNKGQNWPISFLSIIYNLSTILYHLAWYGNCSLLFRNRIETKYFLYYQKTPAAIAAGISY